MSGDLQHIFDALVRGEDWRRSGTNMGTGEKGKRYEVICTDKFREIHYWGSIVAQIKLNKGRPVDIVLNSCGYMTKQTCAVINEALGAFNMLLGASYTRIKVSGSCTSRRSDTSEWWVHVGDSKKRWYGEVIKIDTDGCWRSKESEKLWDKEVRTKKEANKQAHKMQSEARAKNAARRKIVKDAQKRAKYPLLG